MIYSWNPKTRKVFIPDVEVTIPQVKSFNDAKALVEADDFNPNDWAYIVKSKSGKVYNFHSYEDAVDFAKNKSTSRVAYTIFHKDKSIAGFQNKKTLTDWTTVYTEEPDPFNRHPSVEEWIEEGKDCGISRKTWRFGEWPLHTSIEVAPGKVRLSKVRIKYVQCPNGKVSISFPRKNTILHSNGNIYVWENGKIICQGLDDTYSYMTESTQEALCKELIRIRPELKSVLKCSHNMIKMFARPCAFFSFDTFHNNTKPKQTNSVLRLAYYPREIVDESKLIDVLAKRMNIPNTKGLKKIYYQNLGNMKVVKTLKDLGFNDINSYYKLISLGILLSFNNSINSIPFFRQLIKLRGENNTIRMISNANLNDIRDTAITYPDVQEESADFVMKNASNINEIHDTFNMLLTSQHSGERRKDIKIQYTKEEMEKYNFVCKDGLCFQLAEGSKDLAIIGASMGICVGGYASMAIAKRCIIVKVMKGEKYIACIEVDAKGVSQIKAKFNNPVKAEYKHNIDEWLAHGNLLCTCHDYYDIGKESNSTQNYAYVNPEEFEPREHHDVLRIIKREHPEFIHVNKWLTKEENPDYPTFYRRSTKDGLQICID